MVRKTWDDHLRGQPNSHKLWTMLMFQSWLENQEQAPRAEEAPVAALAV